MLEKTVKTDPKIPEKIGCKRSIYRVYMYYTEKLSIKKVKAMGLMTQKKAQLTKLSESV